MASAGCTENMQIKTQEKLLRQSYVSTLDNTEREYFIYLPKGYENSDTKNWPVMLFLHGNGERGNGKDELDYVLAHGPLYEAWIQKRDLPFIIISPQLHMFDFDKQGLDYIDNRTEDWIPKRLENGVPPRDELFATPDPMKGVLSAENMSEVSPPPKGWEKVEGDLLGMLDYVSENFHADNQRIYLTGLSYGGFGSWYMASKHPERFAAVAPVVGWGEPSLMAPIAKAQLPVWAFAGGRDNAVRKQLF